MLQWTTALLDAAANERVAELLREQNALLREMQRMDDEAQKAAEEKRQNSSSTTVAVVLASIQSVQAAPAGRANRKLLSSVRPSLPRNRGLNSSLLH